MARTTSVIYFLFILISLSYAGFILWLTDGIRYLTTQSTVNPISPEVSVIISARNEEDNLDALLASLTIQNYPNKLLKIIIMSNQSRTMTTEK